jgi:hypothetical protein
MTNRSTILRMSTGLATIALSLSGVLLSAAPASAAPTPNIVITSPINGSTLDSSSFVITGTAPIGAILSFFEPESGDSPALTTVADADGAFSFASSLARANGYLPEQLTVFGTTSDGTALDPASISVQQAPLFAAPVITSPPTGSALTGSTVVVSGTALPGMMLVVSAYDPVRYLTDSAYTRVSGWVTVDALGNWSAPIALLPGDYILGAALVEGTPGNGTVVSEFAANVLITLAAAAPAPAAPAELAATGGSAAPAGALGLGLLVAGLAFGTLRRMVVAAA